jgi:hypothetical protein
MVAFQVLKVGPRASKEVLQKRANIKKSSLIVLSMKGTIGKKEEGSCSPPLDTAWKFPS